MNELSDIFVRGTLEMSRFPSLESVGAGLWIDIGFNRILLVIAVLSAFIALKAVLQFAPQLFFAADRTSATIALEQNYSLARVRNRLALGSVLPVCLIADSYRLFRPDWWSYIPDEWSVLALMGVLLTYCLLRRIAALFFTPRRLPANNALALRRSPYTFFIFLVLSMFATLAPLRIVNLSSDIICWIFIAEIAVAYMFSIARIASVLRQNCKGLPTFLYLCGLEILPMSILVVSALF